METSIISPRTKAGKLSPNSPVIAEWRARVEAAERAALQARQQAPIVVPAPGWVTTPAEGNVRYSLWSVDKFGTCILIAAAETSHVMMTGYTVDDRQLTAHAQQGYSNSPARVPLGPNWQRCLDALLFDYYNADEQSGGK